MWYNGHQGSKLFAFSVTNFFWHWNFGQSCHLAFFVFDMCAICFFVWNCAEVSAITVKNDEKECIDRLITVSPCG